MTEEHLRVNRHQDYQWFHTQWTSRAVHSERFIDYVTKCTHL